MALVYVTRELPGTALHRLALEHEVRVWPGREPPSPDRLRRESAGAQGLLSTLSDRVDHELITALDTLQVVANYAVGYDNIDLRTAARRGIAVGNTPDVLTDATADLTWALLMAAARRLAPAIDNARTDWRTWEPAGFLGVDVAGATLGIIGAGRIGEAVARRAAGFDMTVLRASREPATLRRVLREADFISLHCPLTDQTRHLIDADALALVKPTAVLINTARGPIVDQHALAVALHEGRLGAAALDVTDPEPLAATDALWQAPNLLITPHIGSATTSARDRMAQMAVDNLLAGLAGRPLPYPVRLP